ncbi:MAG: DNA-binding protein [Gemmatimonadota bacterium]
MSETLVNSHVILDVRTEDRRWFEWSSAALEEQAERSVLVINPLIYAEVSIRFKTIEDLDDALPASMFRRDALPFQAGFLAAKGFVKYRRAGGERRSPLPEFYIGAHAAIAGMTLLTREGSRYLTYFPSLQIVSPS